MTPDLLPERLASRIAVADNGCWIWQGARTQKGYGMTSASFCGQRPTHRATYTLLIGPIPDGYEVDHLCRVGSCCNPQHLEPVTRQENRRRSPFAPERRTHCPKGHPYEGANLYINAVGARVCKACQREASRAQAAKRKAWRKENPFVRTVCGNGLHPWPESMHVTPSGARQCIECRRASRRRYKASKRPVRTP